MWDYQPIRSAKGARVGLVGLGHTGEAVARLCRATGLSVIACRASPAPSELVDRVYAPAELRKLLSEVDVVAVCTALTAATRDLFDAKAFAAMPKGSYFINVARGAIVVEEALIDALRNRRIGGAALDTFDVEPLPEDHPFRRLDNVVATGHVGYVTEGSYRTFYGQTV